MQTIIQVGARPRRMGIRLVRGLCSRFGAPASEAFIAASLCSRFAWRPSRNYRYMCWCVCGAVSVVIYWLTGPQHFVGVSSIGFDGLSSIYFVDIDRHRVAVSSSFRRSLHHHVNNQTYPNSVRRLKIDFIVLPVGFVETSLTFHKSPPIVHTRV